MVWRLLIGRGAHAQSACGVSPLQGGSPGRNGGLAFSSFVYKSASLPSTPQKPSACPRHPPPNVPPVAPLSTPDPSCPRKRAAYPRPPAEFVVGSPVPIRPGRASAEPSRPAFGPIDPIARVNPFPTVTLICHAAVSASSKRGANVPAERACASGRRNRTQRLRWSHA